MKLIKVAFLTTALSISLFASKITQSECIKKGGNFIFAGGECIETRAFEGEKNGILNIVVHGAWKNGTNTLTTYAPFAETLSMDTDITTVAVALPGYANSSTNNFNGLVNKKAKASVYANPKYVEFMSKLVKSLKDKFKAKKVNYIGHSAGSIVGATLTGYSPNLIEKIVCAGGAYDIHKYSKGDNLISLVDVVNKVPNSIKFLIIYGTKDKISPPKRNIDFYNELKAKGKDVKLVKIEGAKHFGLEMEDKAVEEIEKFLKE